MAGVKKIHNNFLFKFVYLQSFIFVCNLLFSALLQRWHT